jgi:type I restriction enzyme R subunit
MSDTNFSEDVIEQAALAWFEGLGYQVISGPRLAPGESTAERETFSDVVLAGRLRESLVRLNKAIPPEALEDAFRKLTRPEAVSLVANNRILHRMLVEGVEVEYRAADGRVKGDRVHVIDWDDFAGNDWLAVNQFTVVENHNNRRPDVVVFLNGLPVAVIELKNAADENATIWSAFNQLQTYKQQISSLFFTNALLIVSDGLEARIGTLTADRERFMPWRTIAGETLAPASMPELQVMMEGVFEKHRLLLLLRHFVVFEDDGKTVVKKLAGYHQFHAVNAALAETLRAVQQNAAAQNLGVYEAGRKPAGELGDKRIGVVWHTQGSGKSLTMAFYAGRVVLERSMENPTLVILTDRNDLDDQLFGTFSRCHELLRQKPQQAKDRTSLRELLNVAAGGVIFTTIQKFLPETVGDSFPTLSDRRNVVVIADEAHRSQYDFIDGYARHMRDALPNASFIGFTGTPIDTGDKNTRAIFGDYVSIYDIQRAVLDGATVPIYYESRLAKLALLEGEKPKLDEEFEEVTEGEETDRKEKLKSRWAQLEALVGTEKRIALIARDLVEHFEQRLEIMDGKAMVVCMSRRICVALYEAIVKLRPEWHSDDDNAGAIKVVMTGSASDPLEWQGHIRNKPRREELAKRIKNPKDPFKIVIVRDMWLTGFDAPCMHTMYIDKPMRGHGLMQAIARVNRVFKDKPGGLVVDYLGLADQLKHALATYTESGGTGKTAIDQAEAVAAMLEKYEVCCNQFHGFDWGAWTSGTPAAKLSLLPAAQEHVLSQDDGKNRILKAVTDLSKAFALAVPHEAAIQIRDDVAFFQAVRAALAKSTPTGKSGDELDHAVRQIIANAVAPEGVIDLFAAAGLKKPDISILSDEFLADVREMPHKNLAVEMLRKLLAEEIRVRAKKNVVQSRSFSDMLGKAMRAYQNRAVETAQVIEELIQLAREMKAAQVRGESLGLNDDEVAFYDALEANDSAVLELGDETLKKIARELVDNVKRNVSIDWTVKEGVRAKLRVLVKRILRKYGYPPDKQEKAAETVLQQAELLSAEWVGA